MAVALPFIESLVRRLVEYHVVGRAMDFMAKSAVEIIKARRMDSDKHALVVSL